MNTLFYTLAILNLSKLRLGDVQSNLPNAARLVVVGKPPAR